MGRLMTGGLDGLEDVSLNKKKKNTLPDTVHKIMLDGQSEELDRSNERDLHQIRLS